MNSYTQKTFLLSAILLLFCNIAIAQRLPGGVTPKHYQLTFIPDFTADNFTGETIIDVQIEKPTKIIALNAVDIDFHDVQISAAGSTQKATVTLLGNSEMANLAVEQGIPAGAAKIAIRYTGTLNSKLRGLYLSQANGRKYAVSQMEATDARRAFPSFDEPAYKATFDIAAVIDKNDSVLSNGRQISDTPEPDGKHRVKFATTPKMSTYLVALAVGDWRCSQGEQDGIPLRVCSIPGKENLTQFGLEATKQVLKFYNEYYGIKYPFGKLDQVAIPDFEAGAMENTGLITYRETYLLVDDKNTSEEKKKFIAEVIAHEIAHQWFGDLVTMKWWDDIWLNEGFATWMETKPLAKWRPDWHVELDDAKSSIKAMDVDSLANTRPIHQEAESRAEINSLFDGIAYEKTAAVLRMIENYAGEESFRKGINAYLSKHAYGNASAVDFWTIMADTTGKPLDTILASFVQQPGMPYVAINARCEAGKTRVELSQRRFFYDRQRFSTSSGAKWQVPVCFNTGSGARQCELLTQPEETATLDGCLNIAYGNADAAGFYRHSSTEPKSQNATNALTEPERLSLLDNEWALVQSGARTVPQYLSLTERLRDDRTPAVVYQLAEKYRYIHRYLLSKSDQPGFEAWVRSILRPQLNVLGDTPRPDDSASTNELRATLFRTLALAGDDQAVIGQARRIADQYLKSESSVGPELASAAVEVAAANGDRALYDRFLSELKSTRSVDKYYVLFHALAEFRDPALLSRTLAWSLTPEVRNQDLGIIGDVMANPQGGKLAWEFVKSRGADIHAKSSVSDFGRITSGLSTFCDSNLLNDVKDYFQSQTVGDRRSRQMVEDIQYCVDLKQQQAPALANWLHAQGSAGAAK